ncbi:MAG: hypothetical protein ACPG5T_07405, partial [Endozoicomonas sp.]
MTVIPGSEVSRVAIPVSDTSSITIRDAMGKPQTMKNLKERKIEKLDDAKTENSQRYQTLKLSLKYGQFTTLSLEAAPAKAGKESELVVTLSFSEQLQALKKDQLEALMTQPPNGKGYTPKEAEILANKGLDWAAECFHKSPEQLEDQYKAWIESAPNRTDNPAVHKRLSRSDSGYDSSSGSGNKIERPQLTQHAPGSLLSEESKARIQDWMDNITPPEPEELPMEGGPGARRAQHADTFEENSEDVYSRLLSEGDLETNQGEETGAELKDTAAGNGNDYYHEDIN